MEEQTNNCPVPNGILLVIGGHEEKSGVREKEDEESSDDPMEILKEFVALMDRDNPRIEVVTSASAEGDDSFKDYVKAFKELDIPEIGHIHHDRRSEVLHDDLIGRIKEADGIFFTGGDQLKLTSIYGGTLFLRELKQQYIFGGLVLAGTSAGAMAFSTPMIFAGSKEKQQIAGEVKIATGLEFLKDVCIDTHFVDRSRFIRMAQVIATNPTSIGIGIEENTAIIVRNGSDIEVTGNGVVTIIEGHWLTDSNITDYGSDKLISIHDLNVKLLAKGSHYKFKLLNPPHL